jgi:hydroxymethylpyrimidine/phosphomethylpyrimidine kinase
VLDDTEVLAMKTGMLANAPTARMVVDTLKHFYASRNKPFVIMDPVCISTSGHTLLSEDAIHILDELASLATLITPNRAEAETLLRHRGHDVKIRNLPDMIHGAQTLSLCGCSAVLVKGGHVLTDEDDVDRLLKEQPMTQVFWAGGIHTRNMEILSTVSSTQGHRLVVDVLVKTEGEIVLFISPFIDSSSTHGTGCTLSAAITSYMAKGDTRKAQSSRS